MRGEVEEQTRGNGGQNPEKSRTYTKGETSMTGILVEKAKGLNLLVTERGIESFYVIVPHLLNLFVERRVQFLF